MKCDRNLQSTHLSTVECQLQYITKDYLYKLFEFPYMRLATINAPTSNVENIGKAHSNVDKLLSSGLSMFISVHDGEVNQQPERIITDLLAGQLDNVLLRCAREVSEHGDKLVCWHGIQAFVHLWPCVLLNVTVVTTELHG